MDIHLQQFTAHEFHSIGNDDPLGKLSPRALQCCCTTRSSTTSSLCQDEDWHLFRYHVVIGPCCQANGQELTRLVTIDTVRLILKHSSQDFMVAVLSRAAEFYQLVQFALSTNWFGLSCPLHCGSPGFAALGFSYLLGLSSGVSLSVLLGFFLYHRLGHLLDFRPPAVFVRPAGLSSRLQGYLHES